MGDRKSQAAKTRNVLYHHFCKKVSAVCDFCVMVMGKTNVYFSIETIVRMCSYVHLVSSYRAAIKGQALCDAEMKKVNVVSSLVVTTAMK